MQRYSWQAIADEHIFFPSLFFFWMKSDLKLEVGIGLYTVLVDHAFISHLADVVGAAGLPVSTTIVTLLINQ